ncbi:MAG TPA: adenylate/guanylate cyclase domain-containing protein, partial [Alphaproteobacteria bacterium]|nr:adenylate/guanylate cyclase domain-containing protein [Alphaproteobacteria bacterium]
PPLSDADGPARAAAAARKIAVAITEDNRQRAREGQPPLQVRIGIHTGPTLVGNIGAPGRVNYTVVGDTVNVAQRLQDYGRHICPQAECVVLASAATVTALAEGDRGHCIGPLPIRGREEAIVGWQIAP